MSKKYKVSLAWIAEFMHYLNATAFEIPVSINSLNLENNESINILVKQYLLLEFANETPSRKFKIKESLRYGLNFWSEQEFRDILDEMDVDILIPDNMQIKELYSRIWTIMFPYENFMTIDKSNYEEVLRVLR